MVTIINNQPAEFVHSIVTYTKNLGSPIKKKKTWDQNYLSHWLRGSWIEWFYYHHYYYYFCKRKLFIQLSHKGQYTSCQTVIYNTVEENRTSNKAPNDHTQFHNLFGYYFVDLYSYTWDYYRNLIKKKKIKYTNHKMTLKYVADLDVDLGGVSSIFQFAKHTTCLVRVFFTGGFELLAQWHF